MKQATIVLLLVMIQWTTTAQWSTDPAVNNLVCNAASSQSTPLTISDGAGGVIVVWNDSRTGLTAIYAQRFDAFGQSLWTQNGVLVFRADTAGQSFFSKDAVSDGAGGAIICWSAYPQGNLTGVDIFVQRIDAAGMPQWTPNGYPLCFALGIQTQPRICSDGAGGAIVAWTDFRTGNFSPEIYAHRIDMNGSPVWQPLINGVLVCSAFGGSRGLPILIPDPPGGAIIAWSDSRSFTRTEPYLQKLNASGQRMWNTSGVSASSLPENKFLTDMVSDGSGGVILGWQQNYSISGYILVVGQRINASGTLLWGNEGTFVLDSQPRAYGPRLVSDLAGGAIFAWRDVRDSVATLNDIFAQRVDGMGAKLWNADGVPICQSTGNQVQISMASTEDGGAIIAWQDHRISDSNIDIYAQKVRSNGVVAGPVNGLPVSTATSNQQRPSSVSDGSGGGIIAWEDSRNGSLDIYAQLLSSVGLPLTITNSILQTNTNYPFQIGSQTLLTANFGSLGTVGTMTALTYLGTQPPGLTKAIPRYLDLSANGTGFDATLTFNYTDAEVAAAGLVNGDANLNLYKNEGAGWVLQGGTVDVNANTVTLTGVTSFSLWAMRDPTDTLAVSVDEPIEKPADCFLYQNYPNPFNPSTTIAYSVPERTTVEIKVLDVLGREVATLLNEQKSAGAYTVRWDANGVASGMYFYRLKAGSFVQTKKLILLR